METFSFRISNSIKNFADVANKIEKNMEFIFNYNSQKSPEDISELLSAISVIEIAITSGEQLKSSLMKNNNIIVSLPKYEKHFNRSSIMHMAIRSTNDFLLCH